MKDPNKKLTTVAGAPVVDNQNTMTVGPRAKGSGAYGTSTGKHDSPTSHALRPIGWL